MDLTMLVTRLPEQGNVCDDLLRFLAALHELKREIEEKAPGYFEFRSLRCRVAPEATLELPDAAFAAGLMLGSAGDGATSLPGARAEGGRRVRFVTFCDWLGMAYEMAVIPVGESGELNAVDRLFDQRVAWFWRWVGEGLEAAAGAPHGGLAELTGPEQEPWQRLLESVYRSQEAGREMRDRRIDELPARLERHTVNREGASFSYFTAGSPRGIPVVLLNALGQGLRYWYRLIDCLMPRHRVILWEPRGTAEPPPPFGIEDQVEDLAAILRQQGIETCHLVGWCTGPKVALRFCRLHPEKVESLVLLNSTFKHLGSAAETTTDYENNIESLCRMVAERPSMAGPLMRALQATSEHAEIDLAGSGGEQCSREVLSRVSVDLRREVLGPFRDERTTINYSHQLIDFVAYDALADAAGVSRPMLVVASEYDKVAAPAMSRMAAAVFDHSHCLQLRGASHYCLYDRPDLIAGLMETFFSDEKRLPGRRGEMVEIA